MAAQITAHRGASHDAPENTLAALDLAWKQGADAVEVDVRLSRDGHLVVFHDPDTLRTTGVPGKIGELTLAQIRALDAGSWKGEAWRGEKIPTLEEVLGHQPPDKQLVIELKGNASLLPSLHALLERTRCPHERLFLISFDVAAMQEAKSRFPHIPVLLLFGFDRETEDSQRCWQPRIKSLIARAQEVGADGLNLCQSNSDDLAWIEQVKAAGLEAFVWTVDDPEAAQGLVAAGIDGLTTNRPGWMRTELRKRGVF